MCLLFPIIFIIIYSWRKNKVNDTKTILKEREIDYDPEDKKTNKINIDGLVPFELAN